jgi:hypothetical protein
MAHHLVNNGAAVNQAGARARVGKGHQIRPGRLQAGRVAARALAGPAARPRLRSPGPGSRPAPSSHPTPAATACPLTPTPTPPQRDSQGWTPLHRAAHLAHLDGYLEIYEYLLVGGFCGWFGLVWAVSFWVLVG